MVAFPGSKVSRLLLLALLWSGLSLPLQAEEDGRGQEETPAQWLGRMNRSVAHLSFEGDFVYLSGRLLEAMRLRHQIVDGRPRESLFSLTGQRREIVRDANVLTITTWVDGRPRKISHPSSGRLSPLKPLEADALRRHYRLMMGKPARIAGREGVVVALIPRDDLRYGYRLTLDRESALPLDLTVMDGAGNLVSRIMFTRLRLHGDGREENAGAGQLMAMEQPVDFEPGTVHTIKTAAAEGEDRGPVAGEPDSGWSFEELPAGFRLVSHKFGDVGAGKQEHFVFSDGLATISAYVEPLGEGDRPFNGETSLGSVNAYGRQLDGHQLTVVGEVPHRTLRLLANAMRWKG